MQCDSFVRWLQKELAYHDLKFSDNFSILRSWIWLNFEIWLYVGSSLKISWLEQSQIFVLEKQLRKPSFQVLRLLLRQTYFFALSIQNSQSFTCTQRILKVLRKMLQILTWQSKSWQLLRKSRELRVRRKVIINIRLSLGRVRMRYLRLKSRKSSNEIAAHRKIQQLDRLFRKKNNIF